MYIHAPPEGGGKADKVHMAIRRPDYQIMGTESQMLLLSFSFLFF